MKLLLSFPTVLLFAGCLSQPQSTRSDAQGEAITTTVDSYVVLTDAPDAILYEMSSKYLCTNQ